MGGMFDILPWEKIEYRYTVGMGNSKVKTTNDTIINPYWQQEQQVVNIPVCVLCHVGLQVRQTTQAWQ